MGRGSIFSGAKHCKTRGQNEMKRTTGAVIGAITGLVIAAAAGSGEVAEASAGVGAIAGATLGAFFTGSRAAEHKTIKPKRKATTTATAEHKIIKSKRRAEIEHINLARLPDQSIFKNLPKLKAPAGYVYIIQDVSAWHRYKIGYRIAGPSWRARADGGV